MLFEFKLVFILLAILFICSLGIYIQYKRLNNVLPIFDPGIFLILTTSLYCAYPIFSYVMSGFGWSEISDRRLWKYQVSTQDFSDFMMKPFYYLLAILFSYLLFCGPKIIKSSPKLNIIKSKTEVLSVLFLFASIHLYFYIFSDYVIGSKNHAILQLNNFLSSVRFTFLLYLVVYIFAHCKNTLLKIVLFIFLTFQAYLTFIEGYGRTAFFLQLISVLIAYHYFVKKIQFKFALFLFVSLFVALMLKGFMKYGVINSFGEYSAFSAANEFTILIGTAYDIHYRITHGLITAIPLQAYFNDLILLVPSQLLPFEKIDLSQWYLKQIGLHGTGVGMMFGVISQAIIGGGIFELIIRGLLLGYLFSVLFRWFYSKQSVSIWNIVFMIFIAVKSYYTYRAGSGYLLYFIVYHFFGAYLLYLIIIKLVSLKNI